MTRYKAAKKKEYGEKTKVLLEDGYMSSVLETCKNGAGASIDV
jgi:hypothetical protein